MATMTHPIDYSQTYDDIVGGVSSASVSTGGAGGIGAASRDYRAVDAVSSAPHTASYGYDVPSYRALLSWHETAQPPTRLPPPLLHNGFSK